MKKYSFLLILLVGLMACSIAPSPPSDDGIEFTSKLETIAFENDTRIMELISMYNSQVQVLRYYVEDKLSIQFQDEIIFVDKLNLNDNLYASLSTGYQQTELPNETIGYSLGFLKEHWIALIIGVMAFVKVVVNLTPSEKDNKIFAWLDSVIHRIIPNLKQGGGTHATPD